MEDVHHGLLRINHIGDFRPELRNRVHGKGLRVAITTNVVIDDIYWKIITREFEMLKPYLALCLLSLLIVSGCAAENDPKTGSMSEIRSVASLNEAELGVLRKEVSDFATSYFLAMEALDEEAILGHVIDAPNFAYTRRGSRSNIDQFKTGTKRLTTSFTDKVSTMGPMTVDFVKPDVAVVTHTFDQTLTTTGGEKRDFTGTVTWIAIKENGEWRYIHGLSY